MLGKAQLSFCNHPRSTGIWGRFSRASAPLPDVSLFFFPLMGTVRYFLLSHCSNTTESVRESIQKPIAQEACIILQMGKLSHSCLHQQNPRHRATGSSNLNPPLSWKTQLYLAQEMFSTDFKAARNSLPDLSFLGFAACKWCVLRPGTEQGPKTTTSEDRSLFVTALKADMG